MVIRIPDLIKKAAKDASVGISVSIFDSTNASALPIFMGGADIFVDNQQRDGRDDDRIDGPTVIPALARNLTDIQESATRYEQRTIQIADKTWTIAVTSQPGSFESSLVFVIFGGTIIAVASVILAIWFYTNMWRVSQMQKMKAQAEAEKAALILDAAKKQTASEKSFNEFLSHEVRNPLCSAIAALSFVAAATKEPVITKDTQKRMKEDVAIIDASLQFINELLRNMLGTF